MPFEKELEELKRRAEKALEMGGPDKVKRQHGAGERAVWANTGWPTGLRNSEILMGSFFKIGWPHPS